MKKFSIFCLLTFFEVFVYSQSPMAINYQAVLRDASGNIRTNTNVALRVDIIQTSATGTSVYAETFAATTNAFGLINLQVGKGTVVSGTFNTIDWAAGSYFIKITVDGTEMSTSQMLSVPYALYAAKAGNGFSGAYNDLSGKPNLFSGSYNDLTGKPNLATVATTGSYNDLSNKPVFTEADPVYNLSVAKSIKASDTARWSDKSNFSGDYNTLTNKPTILDNGKYNTSTGANSLASNTTGNGNSAYGINSLASNTSGNSNTAIGVFSLGYNNVGHSNTAVGLNSLARNTSGFYNTAIGVSSLETNTLGTRNVAIGVERFIIILPEIVILQLVSQHSGQTQPATQILLQGSIHFATIQRVSGIQQLAIVRYF